MTPNLPPANARGALPLGRRELEALRVFSTPAVCDAIAELAPERRASGFTTGRLFAARPGLAPMVGYACTATVRSAAPAGPEPEAADLRGWLEAIGQGRKPVILALQELDGRDARACCGAALAHMLAALGCVGLLTDGALCGLPRLPEGFQALAGGVRPAGGWPCCLSAGGRVTVAGLRIAEGDILHADASGAVLVPPDLVRAIPDHIAHMRDRDAGLLAECRRPGVEFDRLKAVLVGRRQTRWCP